MNEKNKIILLLGIIAFLANGDNYAVAPLLINIAKDLNLTISTASLSVTAYMISFGLFTLLFGPLSDKFGKARIITISAIGTSIFSILGGFAFNLPSLIFFRAVNGAFGAGIFPVTMAFVGQMFQGESRHKALGKVMGLMFLGGASATAIGGILSYIGSWRLVYIFYGIGELIIALIMLKVLKFEKTDTKDNKINLINSYKLPLSNFRFMRLVGVIFFLGLAVFGTFTFTGKLLASVNGFNTLQAGFFLSLFGIGSVIGGKLAPKAKPILKHGYFLSAGIIGFSSLFIFSNYSNNWMLGVSLIGFGMAFIFMQSVLINTAQEKLHMAKGTAMSFASFGMFMGGAIGTIINAYILDKYGVNAIFSNASYILLGVGFISAILIARFEMRKRNGYYKEE